MKTRAEKIAEAQAVVAAAQAALVQAESEGIALYPFADVLHAAQTRLDAQLELAAEEIQ
jgi:hypothetical protein